MEPMRLADEGAVAGVTSWLTDAVRAEFEDRGLWTDETWIQFLLSNTQREPDAVSVVDERGVLSRREVLEHARRIAHYMYSCGVRPGDVVTLVLPNWSEFVTVHAAIGLLGCVVNPLLPKSG
ncbi:MAG TPA: AMP-binding protein, partial [Candidatus Acidoferrum sp.]|nr:AMP-binding protein [Candidatus Acidoferrum sp.]